MNILIDDLPNKVEIDDKIYNINSDYKTALRVIMAWEDDELTINDKIFLTLDNLYDEIPQNHELAYEKAMLFLNCGEEDDKKTKKNNKKLYSFTKDSKYIFSAVDSVTDGKLSSGVLLHWWVFCIAFMEVSEASFFSRLIELRTKKQNGKLSKEERTFWRQNKEILEIEIEEKDIASKKEIENMDEFDRKLKEAQERRKLNGI
jgi:hypothetical protein